MLVNAPTLTTMWETTCSRMFFAKSGIVRGSSMTMAYDHLLKAESMAYEMDVWYDLHLTKSRFPVLQRTYLNLEEYEDFLVRCRNVLKEKGAVTKLTAVPHKPRGINRTKKTGNYAHGGCILGWGFRVHKPTGQPILTMHSRTSYIMYLGALDLALCYCMAKEIGAELGFKVEDFGFRWFSDCLAVAHMQSVSYVWNRPDLMEAIRNPRKFPDAEYPTIKLMRSTIRSFIKKKKEGFTPEQEKYAQLMRYRKRWEARVDGNGKWGSIPVDTLNLSSLRATRVQIPQGEDIELVERKVS